MVKFNHKAQFTILCSVHGAVHAVEAEADQDSDGAAAVCGGQPADPAHSLHGGEPQH